jgi:hypothetical protein
MAKNVQVWRNLLVAKVNVVIENSFGYLNLYILQVNPSLLNLTEIGRSDWTYFWYMYKYHVK